MLGRDTNWRQGDILDRASAATLQLVQPDEATRRVIVITHDCDLPHAGDPLVEVIVGTLVVEDPRPDPRFTYAKNPRRLHLEYEQTAGGSLILELLHSERRNVQKDQFARHAVRDTSLSLTADQKRILKQWLAARYGRPAFPNEFERRLRKRLNGLSVVQQIERILEAHARHLVGLFFDLGDHRRDELPPGEPYVLSIAVVYDAREEGVRAMESASRVASDLRNLFEISYGPSDIATDIALEKCEAVADSFITLADLRRVDQWRLEYVSLRDGDHGDYLPVGEMPA